MQTTPLPDRQVNVKLPDDIFIALVAHAAQQRVTRTSVVVRALQDYLAREAPRQAAS